MTTLKALVGILLLPVLLIVWVAVAIHAFGLGLYDTVFDDEDN